MSGAKLHIRAIVPSVISLTVFLTSCGLIQRGSSSLNEAEPSLPVIAAGPLTALNGKAVSGGVVIYGNPGDATSIVRFTGLTMPSEGPFYADGSITGGSLVGMSVRSTTGTYNTTVNVPGSASWTVLTLRNSLNINYAQAFLH